MNPHKASLPDAAPLQNQWASREPESLLAHLHRGELYRMAREAPPQQQLPHPPRNAAPGALRPSTLSLQDLRHVIQHATCIMEGNDEDLGTTAASSSGTRTSDSSPATSNPHDLQRRHSNPPSQ